MSGPGRILIVKLSSLGDVVQSLPVAAALRRRFPDSYIAWAVGAAAADILTGNPHLDEVLVVGAQRDTGASGTRAIPGHRDPAGLRRALRSIGFDVTLDLQGLLKSASVAYLSGARDRFGFRTLREGTLLLNNRHIVARRGDVHAVESYLDFAEALGAPRQPVEFTITIDDSDRTTVDGLLGRSGDFAALIPGARWESKLWPTERFAAVADSLARNFSVTSVIVGAAGDSALARAVADAASTPVVDLTGKTTLKQLAEVLRRCRVTVGNDTGPLYVSAAMGTPTVAVFGPTDARRLGPYGEGHARVIAEIECAPCRNRRCERRRCMEMIDPDRVVAAASALLRRAEA